MTYDEEKHWWLDDDIINKEVIRFCDRIEFKKNGEYHNLSGAAIRHNNDDNSKYYINGVNYTYDEWNFKMRSRKIKKLMEKSKPKKESN